MRPILRFIAGALVSVAPAQAPIYPQSVAQVLGVSIQPVPVTAYQVQRYMMERIFKPPAPEAPSSGAGRPTRCACTCLMTSPSTVGRTNG